MNGDWHIRAADMGDAPALQLVMEAAYATYQARMGGERLPPMGVNYADEIRGYPVWVAESGGKVAGGLIMVFEDGCASIANIAVHPDCQGHGLGGGLMRFAENVARERGFSELELATHARLTENLSLYRHLGWAETGRDGVRVHMKKAI